VSSHKPRQVLDKLRTFYETSYANVHRGVYTLSEIATAEYEGAREKVAQFVNAPDARELIFTRGATESINLVAYAWGLDNLGPGDVVVVTELEHHSNFVPWQYIAKRTGATFTAIPLDEHGELRLDTLDEIKRLGNVKVVANNLVSNALGTINPVERLAAWAHEQGAIMVVDAAQAAPHHAIDVQQLDCDFLAFSSHKMCGPTSVGALWGRASLLETMAPFNLGGHMIRSVTLDETTWGQLPYKFEAGTQPIAEITAAHVNELPRVMRWVMSRVGVLEPNGARVLSYLLFERGYCRHLMRLGFSDAMLQRERILSFLGYGSWFPQLREGRQAAPRAELGAA